MRPMGCSTISWNDDGESRRGTAQRQKNFCCFCCVFRLQKRITYETPIRGYSQHPLKAQRWGRHTRACPSCLRQQVERKIFVMLNLRMQQPSHGEKNYKPLSLKFSGSKQTAPTENFKNAWERHCCLNAYFSRSSCKRKC